MEFDPNSGDWIRLDRTEVHLFNESKYNCILVYNEYGEPEDAYFFEQPTMDYLFQADLVPFITHEPDDEMTYEVINWFNQFVEERVQAFREELYDL